METINFFIHLYIFPGLLFLIFLGFLFEWLDRKLVARFQGRIGPPWYQPFVDFIKLIGKEDINTKNVNLQIAAALPLISFASVATAGVIVPIAGSAVSSFNGDLIVVLFLLSLPSLLYFLAGWICTGSYSILGGNRSLLQYFSYEVLFTLALSGTAIASHSWSISEIVAHQISGEVHASRQLLGFFLAVLGLIGKLKRAPFDIPKAKSEVVAGPLTEFSGKKLALWNLSMQIQTVVGIFLLVNTFFGGWFVRGDVFSWFGFILCAVLIQALLSFISAIYARLRIDQLIRLTWRVMIPLSLIQIGLLVLI